MQFQSRTARLFELLTKLKKERKIDQNQQQKLSQAVIQGNQNLIDLFQRLESSAISESDFLSHAFGQLTSIKPNYKRELDDTIVNAINGQDIEKIAELIDQQVEIDLNNYHQRKLSIHQAILTKFKTLKVNIEQIRKQENFVHLYEVIFKMIQHSEEQIQQLVTALLQSFYIKDATLLVKSKEMNKFEIYPRKLEQYESISEDLSKDMESLMEGYLMNLTEENKQLQDKILQTLKKNCHFVYKQNSKILLFSVIDSDAKNFLKLLEILDIPSSIITILEFIDAVCEAENDQKKIKIQYFIFDENSPPSSPSDANSTLKIKLTQNLSKFTIENLREKFERTEIRIYENQLKDLFSKYSRKIAAFIGKTQIYRNLALFPSNVICFEFNQFMQVYFITDQVDQYFRKQFFLPNKIKFLDPIFKIFEKNTDILIALQQLISMRQEQDSIDFQNEIQKFQIYLLRTKYGAIKNIVVYLHYIPIKRNAQQLLKLWKQKIRLLYNLYRATNAFKSKQMVLKNKQYLNSALVEYLPDADIKQIMLTNEARIMKIDSQKYHTESEKNQLKNVTKFQMLMKKLEPFKPNIESLHQDPVLIQSNTYIIFKFEGLENPNFNMFGAEQIEVKTQIAWTLLNSCTYIEDHPIPQQQFCNFVTVVHFKYNHKENPFHNFVHALTVSHGCLMAITNERIKGILSLIQKFVLVFSGLCHDIDHSAATNVFEVNAHTKLAKRYSDKSVLENHHISQTYKILQHEQTNIFFRFSFQERTEIRKFFISNVLATDNKIHFQTLKDLEIKINQAKEDQNVFCMIPQEDSQMILSAFILHSSDFFGAVKPFEISTIWSAKINQEFTAQYQLEGKLGIPQTPYLKGLDNPIIFAKNESGFLKVIVRPLWEVLNSFTSGGFQEQVDNATQSIQKYEKVVTDAASEQEKK